MRLGESTERASLSHSLLELDADPKLGDEATSGSLGPELEAVIEDKEEEFD